MEELLLTKQKEMESIQAVQAEQQQVEKEELKYERTKERNYTMQRRRISKTFVTRMFDREKR